MSFTSCPNRKSKLNILKQIISQQPQELNSKFVAVLYRSLILKKIFTKRWPQLNLYFLSKPEVKVYYLKQIISQQPQKVHFTIFEPLYRSLTCQQIFTKKVTPIWPLIPVQTGSQSLIFTKSYLNNRKR